MSTVGVKMTQETQLVWERSRKQVTSIEQLEPGDHVAFVRKGFSTHVYTHHGIVISVHPDEDVYNVIEVLGNFTTDKVSGKTSSSVVSRPHKFSTEKEGGVYIVHYKEGECLPTSQVIHNASCLAGMGIAVELVASNCEHFARAIKTGVGLGSEHCSAAASRFSWVWELVRGFLAK